MASWNPERASSVALFPGRTCLVGRGSGMTLYKRNWELALYILVCSVVGVRRTLLLLRQRARRRVPRMGTRRRKEVSSCVTWEKSSALHVTSLDTMLVSVQTWRRIKLLLLRIWKSLPTSLIKSSHWLHVYHLAPVHPGCGI